MFEFLRMRKKVIFLYQKDKIEEDEMGNTCCDCNFFFNFVI